MLYWALSLAIIAIGAGLFGFQRIARGAGGLSQLFFFVFLVGCALFFVGVVSR